VPFTQGYVDTGEFGVVAKVMDSLQNNLRFYLFSMCTFITLTVYIVLNSTAQTLYI
jgi:hypothetical protein